MLKRHQRIFPLACSTATAIDFLKAESFNVQAALNRFYNADVVAIEQDSKSDALFTKYKSTLPCAAHLSRHWQALMPLIRYLPSSTLHTHLGCLDLLAQWREAFAGADAEEDIVDVEGVMKLIQDLQIESTDKALVRNHVHSLCIVQHLQHQLASCPRCSISVAPFCLDSLTQTHSTSQPFIAIGGICQ